MNYPHKCSTPVAFEKYGHKSCSREAKAKNKKHSHKY